MKVKYETSAWISISFNKGKHKMRQKIRLKDGIKGGVNGDLPPPTFDLLLREFE